MLTIAFAIFGAAWLSSRRLERRLGSPNPTTDFAKTESNARFDALESKIDALRSERRISDESLRAEIKRLSQRIEAIENRRSC